MKTAVLGLGLLGSEIALRLKRQGFEPLCWNRGNARAQAARARGLAVAESAAEAIAAADTVLLLLSDAAAIRAALLDDTAAAGVLAGRILVQMGTVAPEESRSLAERTAALGARYLEAPVLGSLPEAREGRLIVMAGGDPELFECCLPVLKALGKAPELIGPVGRGAALKLAMNQLIGGLTTSFALSLGLVRAAGIEPERFMALLRESALYARTFDKKLANYLSHSYGAANFPLKHLAKDIRLFRQAALAHGIDTASLAAIEAACERAEGLGFGDQDYSAVYEAIAGPAASGIETAPGPEPDPDAETGGLIP